MENLEKIRQPEIKTEELLSLLDSIKWKHGYRFSFNGTEFYLNITETEKLRKAEAEGTLTRFGEPAEYFRSTYVRGFDIYLHDTIPAADRNRILFHEILEANLRDQNFSQKEAHKLTLEAEKKTFGQRKN